MGIDYNIVGERLRRARLEKKLTQADLAEKLDISVTYLSKVERGVSRINLKRLQELCALLDISEIYILSGTSEDSKNYLDKDFKNLLEKCSPEQQKLIYNLAKTVIEADK